MASRAPEIKRKRKSRAEAHAARAARRRACGGWPKPRMKARRMRSGSPNPVADATVKVGEFVVERSVDRCHHLEVRKLLRVHRTSHRVVVDNVEVLDGVTKGEEVVTSATFLIDAESNLKAALRAFTQSEPPK